MAGDREIVFMSGKITITTLLKMKQRGEKIAVVTCYDYPSALLLDASGVDIIFTGDSLGNNVLGYDSTLPVTMDEMIHHAKAVRRGTKRALFLVDMPFLSYQISVEKALENAGRFMQEAGAEAVKIEGGLAVTPVIERLTQSGIPVMGHIGMTPQHVHALGGFKLQGRSEEDRKRLIEEALALEEAGAFAITLELVVPTIAQEISKKLTIPTIGIGSGPDCDGQVQVFHDLIGMYHGREFKHARRYVDAASIIQGAVESFTADVRADNYPTRTIEKN